MTVRVATRADAPAIVRTLSRAFSDDPFVRWIIRPDRPRELVTRRYMELALLRLTLRHGAVYTTDDLASAALWAPPGTWDLTLAEQVALLPSIARIVGLSRFSMVARGLGAVEDARPPRPWWFLCLLGTDPGAQGRGLASAVLAPVLARCDREGTPAILDTCLEHNLCFYERHGFRVHHEVTLPEGPRCWSLHRAPR